MSRGGLGNLSDLEVQELKVAFNFFDKDKNGRLDTNELQAALNALGYDSKNPTVYDFIAELNNEENQKRGGIRFDVFAQAVAQKLDESNRKGYDELFHLNVPNHVNYINFNTLRVIADNSGLQYSDEDLKDILERVTRNGIELNIDEYYNIMTKKPTEN